MKKNQIKFFSMAMLGSLALFMATGCQTYKSQNKNMSQYWQQGNLTNAVKTYTLKAEKEKDSKDTVVWRLEQATALRANGQFKESNDAFGLAEERINKYDESAKISVGNEAGALLSNQANLPYEGRSYDGIMLNTYKALNYLQLNEIDKARVEIIRAYQRQQDAVEVNKRRIEKMEEELEKAKDKEAVNKARDDDKFKTQVTGSYTNLDGLKIYSDYVNPFTVYMDGLFFMANPTGASDLERARKSFERVNAYVGDAKFIKADIETVDGLLQGKPLSPATYVIFETGCAPIREQIRIDVPIIVSKVSYVGAAFPKLKLDDNYLSSLTVSANGVTENTTPLASMDSVIGSAFKDELPTIITKTLASTITKAIAAYAVNQAAAQQSQMAGLFAQIGTAVAQAAVNIADTRTWTTLPKEFQVCRISTPQDRKIELSGPGGMLKTEITIGDGTVNLIFVKSINPTNALLVTQIKLDGSPAIKIEPRPAPSSSVIETATPAAVVEASPTAAPAPAPSPEVISEAAPKVVPAVNSDAVPAVIRAVITEAPVVANAPAPLPLTSAVGNLNPTKTTSNPEVERLCALLKSENPNEMIHALKKLRMMDAPEAVDRILPCLDTRFHPNVVRDACRTLAALGNKDIIPAIEPLLNHRRLDVKRDAEDAIAKLRAKPDATTKKENSPSI